MSDSGSDAVPGAAATPNLPVSPDVQALLTFMQAQMTAAADREARLTALLSSSNSGNTSTSQPTTKQISVERPILLSSATLADLNAWEEAWEDYARCQKLSVQDRLTRVSALRQALDEDIKRYLREGIIAVATNADASDIICAVKKYIRRQRNPLLDRIDFYNQRQQRGETFDAFYTGLKESFAACDFADLQVCSACSARMCSSCPKMLVQAHEEILRDRIVVGVHDDDTRHKLLAEQSLTLANAAKICRAEEAAKQTGDGILPSASINAARRSQYQRQKRFGDKPAPDATSKAAPQSAYSSPKKCPQCGRSTHTKSACPAAGKTCNGCKATGHFEKMCPKKSKQPRGSKIGQLKLQQASSGQQGTVSVTTTLNTEETGAAINWIPDSGSDVDAIGLRHLDLLGGFPENLAEDPDVVTGVNGQPLVSVGQISSSLGLGSKTHRTTIHVYSELSDALLSRTSLCALGLLPPNWPSVCRVERKPAPEPTADQIRTELLEEFSDVFDSDSLKPMSGPSMDIQLEPDATPSCVHHARPVPYAFRDQIKEQLDNMVKDGIIEPVSEPRDWCHPIVIVDKKGTTEKRLTVDFKKLNDQIQRPTHPTQPPRDVVTSVSGRFFTKLDARHGYWQVPLSEAARPLTTFITPWGRYQYLRNPQGLISAGDEYNRRMSTAFDNITNFKKVVDDCLVYDDDLGDHVARVRRVLLCAREHGVTLSAKKFVFAATEIEFCGYILNADGWTVDDAKLSAIRDFSTPTNRTDLRSFMGLVNQLAEFTPAIAELATPLRGLLKTSAVFQWETPHTDAFNRVKNALVEPPILAYYQPGLETRLETDASRTKGLGYALFQLHPSGWRLVQCGSRFITDTESRYAMIELECLAVVWAVRKCHLYLAGSRFDLIVDHQPLIPIFNAYSLDQVENPRLQRLLLKLRPYQFHASWRQGKLHYAADALSRAPVSDPQASDLLGEDDLPSGSAIRACLRADDSGSMSALRYAKLQDACASDSEYQDLLQMVLTGFPRSWSDLPRHLQPYWNGREHLSVDSAVVLKGNRIVVPAALRASVLHDLHAAHQGIDRTKRRARQLVYWPGLNSELDRLVRACQPCREFQPSLPREPLQSDRQPSMPFESVSSDLFHCQGWEYLVLVDRLTGWPCVAKIGRTATSSDVVRQLRRWFTDVGVPSAISTDGGPQYASRRFTEFCDRWQMKHITSTPHFPQSNGHAESAVKSMKYLIAKTTSNGDLDTDAFQRGLLEWRNTPHPSGPSPAQLLFGRSLSSFVLAHHSSFAPEWKQRATSIESSDSPPVSDPDSSQSRTLSKLTIGMHVDLQDPRTKRWTGRGIVVGIGTHRDYYVKLRSGRVFWRNRRFLRPYVPLLPDRVSTDSASEPAVPAPTEPVVAPRRSTRNRRQPDRLNISAHQGQSYV
ncbi:uncharacterized protein K02A2.6-like [Sycon ciliatum]|uniref:uncharacterized protein K02A2.6-like n=1 Tax=Sycon ciliatum TaxID=27933 RepID=UPI0031F650E5